MDTEQSIAIGDPTGRAPFFRGMRGTLLGWFVLLALVPMALVSIISYTRAQKALTEIAWEMLLADRETKKQVVLTLFENWNEEVLFVSGLENLKSDIIDMASGFRFMGFEKLKSLYFEKPDLLNAEDGSAYSAVHQEQDRFFKNYTKTKLYEDALLIDLEGNVIYTKQKGPDFGVSLTSEPYRGTNLARLYQDLKTAKQGDVLLADAALFENGVAQFMGTPVYRGGVCLGYLVFQLPLKYLSELMAQREGMGRSGETYLVGPDRRMRTDSPNDPSGRNVKASLSGTVEKNGVDSLSVREALAGKAGACIITDNLGLGRKVMSAYAPLAVKGLQWVILSEIDREEAMAPTAALAKITAGLTVAVALSRSSPLPGCLRPHRFAHKEAHGLGPAGQRRRPVAGGDQGAEKRDRCPQRQLQRGDQVPARGQCGDRQADRTHKRDQQGLPRGPHLRNRGGLSQDGASRGRGADGQQVRVYRRDQRSRPDGYHRHQQSRVGGL